MGRSPDLPDPLENQNAAAAGSGGADDLLAQLAGDEIDRLLAEADADAVSAAPPAQSVPDAAATVDEPAAAPVEEPLPPAPPATAAPVEAEPATDATATVAETPAPKEAGAAEPALETQLDDLFKALNEPAPAAEAAAAPSTPPAPLKPAAAAAAVDLDAQLERLAQELLPMPEQEKALTAVEDQPAAAAAAAKPRTAPVAEPASEEREALLAAAPEELEELAAVAEMVDDGDGEIPWYLRPLVWLNAPFASLSDRGRELVGKVALATLLFSITVLTFLALTRHHL